MNSFTITVVRHGETEENRKTIMQGHMDTDLSDKGRCQGQMCSKRLSNEKFTHVYCSDLKRAQQTCTLLLEQNELTNCEVILDQRLRERNLGIIQGRTHKEFLDMAAKHNWALKDFTPDGGETFEEVSMRMKSFFSDLCVTLYDSSNDILDPTTTLGDVLVVSHGGAIRALICHFVENLGCEMQGRSAVIQQGHLQVSVSNCSVSKFMVTLPLVDSSTSMSSPGENASVACLCINDHDHLVSEEDPLPPKEMLY